MLKRKWFLGCFCWPGLLANAPSVRADEDDAHVSQPYVVLVGHRPSIKIRKSSHANMRRPTRQALYDLVTAKGIPGRPCGKRQTPCRKRRRKTAPSEKATRAQYPSAPLNLAAKEHQAQRSCDLRVSRRRRAARRAVVLLCRRLATVRGPSQGPPSPAPTSKNTWRKSRASASWLSSTSTSSASTQARKACPIQTRSKPGARFPPVATRPKTRSRAECSCCQPMA